MAGNVLIKNANGNTVTLQNPDTNLADVTVEMDKVVVKDSAGNVLVSGSTSQIVSGTAGTTTLGYTFGGQQTKTGISCPANGVLGLNANEEVLVYGGGAFGYGTGAGGSVTQLTSKSTAVTLNKPTGRITMNGAALAAGASVYFTVNNTLVTQNCGAYIFGSGTTINYSNYKIEMYQIINGAFGIRITNISAGSLSEAVVIGFIIIKGSVS